MYDFVFNIEEKPVISQHADHNHIHSTHSPVSIGEASSIPLQDHSISELLITNRNAPTLHCQDLSNPLVDVTDVLAVVEAMQLKPSNGRSVDVVILVSEQLFQKWNFDITCSTESAINFKPAKRIISASIETKMITSMNKLHGSNSITELSQNESVGSDLEKSPSESSRLRFEESSSNPPSFNPNKNHVI